jgi:hypothetical protein
VSTPTFSSLNELQDFLGWCRKNGIQKVKVGEVEAHIIPDDAPAENDALREAFQAFAEREGPTAPDKLPTDLVDKELLLWSAK